MLYRSLQREVREAVDRCADTLQPQFVPAPADDEGAGEIPVGAILRDVLSERDGQLGACRALMVIGEAARKGDAVALFLVERMAARHAVLQMDALMMRGHFGEPELQGPGHAAA
jgi:hypothetical protein